MLRSGIYVGWVGHDNLGDEAMYELCKERFPSVRWSTHSGVTYVPDQKQFLSMWTNPATAARILREELANQKRLRRLATQGYQWFSEKVGSRVGIMGGGTLINRAATNLDAYLDVRRRTKALVPIFGTGVASAEFWSSRHSSEVWQDRRKDWVAALSELPVVGVRGPRSRDALLEAGSSNVIISGDPAIAYHARFRTAPSMALPDRPLRVGINTGQCSGNLWGSEHDIHAALLAATRWLLERKHTVEFLPVWDKDVAACTDLARDAQLPHSTVTPILSSHDAFLGKIVGFDLVIALKLHATVLASAANIPCVALEYQPKCLDFTSSIGWQDFTIRTSKLTPANLIERISFLIETYPQARKTLHENVGKLADQFESYCHQIEPMILNPTS